jgi:hypothetical protein
MVFPSRSVPSPAVLPHSQRFRHDDGAKTREAAIRKDLSRKKIGALRPKTPNTAPGNERAGLPPHVGG